MSKSILIVHDKKSPNTVLCQLIDHVICSQRTIDINLSPIGEASNLSNRTFSLIIFVLPILGDNDLLPEYHLAIENFIASFKPFGVRILVILQGDRHFSDNFVNPTYPIAVKLCNIFKLFNAFRLEDTKLDFSTSRLLAKVVQFELSKIDKFDVTSLDLVSDKLKVQPKWDIEDRLLDFYKKSTGYSLLAGVDSDMLNEIGNLIRKLEPEILNISHASMNSAAFIKLGCLPSVSRVNLSSNLLTLDDVMRIIPNSKELNLAANMLDAIELNEDMCNFRTLLLHKNYISKITFNSSRVSKIKRLSFYRNNLSYFEWPVENTELEYLNLGANSIDRLPESLAQAKELKFLGVARSKISSLPEWLFELPKLEELDISYIEDRLPKCQIEKLKIKGVLLINRPN